MRQSTLAVIIATMLSNPINVPAQQRVSNLSEHCFNITPNQTIGMEEQNTTPERFMRQHPNVTAAINGPQFRNGKTMGLAYLTKNHYFGNEDPGDIRAYFSVGLNGSVAVSSDLDGKMNGSWSRESRKLLIDYWMVIGARPALVIDRKIAPEATDKGYTGSDYRSAIGTKSNDVCFAVSEDKITMNNWADRLQKAGYRGAINLDGGPISQISQRNRGQVVVNGKGTENTRLIIYQLKR